MIEEITFLDFLTKLAKTKDVDELIDLIADFQTGNLVIEGYHVDELEEEDGH